jgi:carboxypeptidase T
MPMKKIHATAILFLAFFMLHISSRAQEKYSKIKIYPGSARERNEILGLLQIDHFYEENGAIISEVAVKDIRQLGVSFSHVRYDILVEDVAARLHEVNHEYFEKRRQGLVNPDGSSTRVNRAALEQPGTTIASIIQTPSAFVVHTGSPDLGGFYTFTQMNAAMNTLIADYPSIASKTSLGTTVNGNNIWCIKISDNVNTDETNEPEVLYIGLQHAREAIGGSSMIFFMQYLCENYATDPRIKDLVDNREIFIIPCMNPDGWERNRVTDPDGGGGWRKNRKVIDTGPTQYGVDLNRNWGVDWGNCAGATSSCGDGTPDSNNDTYWGTSAFSELETQAVRAFVQSHHLAAMIDQHAFGPYYSLPFGRPGLHPASVDSLSIPQQQFYTSIPALMGKFNGMRAGNSPQSVGYEVAGGVKDWMLKGDIGTGTKGVVYGMTGEGGAGGGTGGSYGSFWPPASQIINLSKGIVFQNLQLLYAAGSYVDLQDVSDIAFSTTSGSFSYKIKRIGLEDRPVTISMIPLQNISSAGAPQTINSLPNYYDTHTGTISYTVPASITNGQQVMFAWKVQTGGYTYYDTITKFYNPTQLFYDNMEGSNVNTNWTVSSGWDYATDDKYTGSNSLTESPGGNFTPSSIRTAQYTGTLNLGNATAAYLTFWTKYRAENFQDYMRVQVSTNGTTWISIAGKNTVQEPGTLDGSNINGIPSLTGVKDDWVKEVFDLKAYLTQPSLRFRFYFASDGASSFYYSEDDGFYIDELKVIKSTIPLVTLGVHFIDFSGRLLQDNTIRLDWDAVADNQHDHFDVERSTDPGSFVPVGTVNGNTPYYFIDPSPSVGNNYYRIKAVDRNGQVQYSKVINIIYKRSFFDLSIYPNPVSDELTLRVHSTRPDNMTLQISDMLGRVLYKGSYTISSTGNPIHVDVRSWKPQLYVVKVIDSDNEAVAIEKFIKQ